MGDAQGEMSGLAYAMGMTAAFMVDLAGILIPIAGSLFIALMRLSFFIAGYDMKNSGAMTAINALLETAPIVPCCMIFMWQAHKKNKINIKERKKAEEGKASGGVSGLSKLNRLRTSQGGRTPQLKGNVGVSAPRDPATMTPTGSNRRRGPGRSTETITGADGKVISRSDTEYF